TLLADDGVIVSHIDEHELAHLLLLMAEVFGEENRLGVVVWDKRNPKGDARGLSYQHEHIVLWSKNIAKATGRNALRRTKRNAAEMLAKAAKLFADHKRGAATLEQVNARFGAWLRDQPFSGGELAYSRIDEAGEVYQAVSMAWPNKKAAPAEYFLPLSHPVTGQACPVPARGWRNPPDTMARLAAAGEIVFGPDHTTQPRRKYRLSDNLEENLPSILAYGGSDDALLSSLGIPFDHPKPLKVACELVALARDDGDIVLDFFAGSGTTGHAVMALNAADGKTRRYILIQLPEPLDSASKSQKAAADLCDRLGKPRTIAELTRERLRRAAARIRTEYPDTPADLGFRAYALAPFLSRRTAAN
ncbi:MAG TPA: DNA methyltransferase, partial [Caulobacteraceae bacterium]|nr:DNA methyltransferase [Caulobacteraceae bacterium]